MSENDDLTEEEFAEILSRVSAFLALHYRTLFKAPIIAFTTAITVVTFTGSLWKATWISFAVLLLALFTTWRRYLEPLSFFAFAVAVIAECVKPGALAALQLAFVQQ